MFGPGKKIISKLGENPSAGFNRTQSIAPKKDKKYLYGIFPEGNNSPYDMVEVIKCIVDDSEFEEFKMDYGKQFYAGMPV